ncbi:MAG: hypothetical protein Q9212_000904 [Teloschistes hypoglaucus]
MSRPRRCWTDRVKDAGGSARSMLVASFMMTCLIVLSMRNLASRLPISDSHTVPQIYTSLGTPETETFRRFDGGPVGAETPPYAVQPLNPLLSFETDDLAQQIKIIDFGDAFRPQITNRTELEVCPEMSAPEAFFHDPIGPPAEIWSYGCTVFSIFSDGHLFAGPLPHLGASHPDMVLVEMVHTLGILFPR